AGCDLAATRAAWRIWLQHSDATGSGRGAQACDSGAELLAIDPPRSDAHRERRLTEAASAASSFPRRDCAPASIRGSAPFRASGCHVLWVLEPVRGGRLSL